MSASCIEFQVRASTLAQSLIASLRAHPRCLPPPVAGQQLQRVRFRSASVRNVKQSSFRIWQQMGPHDQGLGFEWVPGITPQLAVAVTVDLAALAAIAAQPNQLVVTESHDATLVFDLECEPSAPSGWLEITVTLADVETASGSLAGGASARAWLLDRINALVDLKPFRFDLSATLAPGMGFMNAGLAADTTGQRLILRGQVPVPANTATAWRNFHAGFITDRLGPHDWAIFLRAADLRLTFQSAVWGQISSALKDTEVTLITVEVGYAAQPGRAVFTITPWLDVPVLGTESLPISLVLSLDAQSGRFVADVDLYGLRDRVASLASVATTILNVLVPGIGILARSLLNDAIADASASIAVAGSSALSGAPAETTFVELPGEPFRYRATIPVGVPTGVQGSIAALEADADGISISGSWSVLNFRQAELEPEFSRFAWVAPSVACGSSGEAVLRDITVHPERYASLVAIIKLDQSGSEPIRLCSVTVVQGPDASSGLTVRWMSSNVPTQVEVRAPFSLLGLKLAQPILIDVATTAGVVRAAIPPPEPLTQADLDWMRGQVALQLEYCDSIVKPEWFEGNGKFEMEWIVDPLHDPDYARRLLDIVTVEVSGLAAGAALVVRRGDALVGRAPSVAGTAQLGFAVRSGDVAPTVAIEAPGDGAKPEGARGFAVRRERWEATSAIALRGVTGITASQRLLPGYFMASHEAGVFLVDGRNPGSLGIERLWPVKGVLGVVETRAGLRAYGEAGLFDLPLDRASPEAVRLLDLPVMDAVPYAEGLALAAPDRIIVVNAFGAKVADAASRTARGLLVDGASMLAIGADGASPCAFNEGSTAELQRGLAGTHVARSGRGSDVFLGQDDGSFIQLHRRAGAWEPVATLSELPVAAQEARSGQTLLHVGQDGLTLYRQRSAGELLPPRHQKGLQSGSDAVEEIV
jgi:hypothetical protein